MKRREKKNTHVKNGGSADEKMKKKKRKMRKEKREKKEVITCRMRKVYQNKNPKLFEWRKEIDKYNSNN